MKYLLSIAAAISILSNCNSNTDYDKYALVYGISEYHINWMNLPYSASDADSISGMLQTYGYNVLSRTNSDVTKHQIIDDLKDMKNRISENDLFLFYFSGHGIDHRTLNSFNIDFDGEDFYAILAFDERPVDSVYDRIQRNLLSDKELHALLADIKTNKCYHIRCLLLRWFYSSKPRC
ncbi:hypothetical protein CHISP_3697 [Chitinispirillum alkaliphilum]|nr:hypothetical protein CHISP_3697 [Chitinispirillum alkaliphilum]